MSDLNIEKIVKELIETFFYAGQISIDLRKKGLIKKIKSDNTPVSNGDLEVNKILTDKIKKVTPELPIISEETSDNKSIKDLNNFWLIDPIDGTYDYINNLEEFTINAGLILNNKPVAGLIYAPAKKECFIHLAQVMHMKSKTMIQSNLSVQKFLIKIQLNLFLIQIRLNRKLKKSIKN